MPLSFAHRRASGDHGRGVGADALTGVGDVEAPASGGVV